MIPFLSVSLLPLSFPQDSISSLAHFKIWRVFQGWSRVCSVAQSCPTLCNPMDNSLPGSSVHGIFQSNSCWRGLPCPSPGDLPNPEIKTTSLEFPEMEGGFFTSSATWEAPRLIVHKYKNAVFRFINPFDWEIAALSLVWEVEGRSYFMFTALLYFVTFLKTWHSPKLSGLPPPISPFAKILQVIPLSDHQGSTILYLLGFLLL